MYPSRKILQIAILALGSSLFLVTQALADKGQIVRLNSEGFRICQSMGSSGYTGTVTGTLLDGSYGSTEEYFSVRYCFASQSACKDFVATLENRVSGISTIRRRSCRPR